MKGKYFVYKELEEKIKKGLNNPLAYGRKTKFR